MKTYTGYRDAAGNPVVWVQEAGQLPRKLDPAPSQSIRNHSPDGFNWGYGGSGPAQLALAILLDVLGDTDAAGSVYQVFKWMHVGHWGDTWSITDREVFDWYAARGGSLPRAADVPPSPPPAAPPPAVIRTVMSCSWCHAANQLVRGGPTYCSHCGHRADVCRLDCDCPVCAHVAAPRPREIGGAA